MARVKGVQSRADFTAATDAHAPKTGPVTARAEEQVRITGKMNPLVDPSGFGVIRRSLPRFEKNADGLWVMAVGTPVPIEMRVDTTSSMQDELNKALKSLPDTFELMARMLPGCDPQMAIGIFGDVCDRIVLCRPQFEMEAKKIVEQITMQVPCRGGGDFPEDPDLGLFGAAYLTATYLELIGLKGYDFTISDATGRSMVDEKELIRVYGNEVFAKVTENGHQINRHDLPRTAEIVTYLQRRAHAFFFQVRDTSDVSQFWASIYGRNRVVKLPSTSLLPQVTATVIGLTEGTLALRDVKAYLTTNNVDARTADLIASSVANIPIGAQAALPNFGKRPQKGDLFRNKTDLWPINPDEVAEAKSPAGTKGKGAKRWL